MSDREGRILRDRRLELGLTQEQVALDLGMSIHQYQLRICAVLELDPYELVFGRDNDI